jgi:phage shock protein C
MMHANDKRLQRSWRERTLLGVAGGLGEYHGIDPVLFRLLFVVGALIGGLGLLAYLGLALVMPAASASSDCCDEPDPALADTTAGLRTGLAAGLALVGLGLVFLAQQLGWLDWLHWQTLWPLLLILIGITLLLGRSR